LPVLKTKFGYVNDLEAPRLDKIIITRGINHEEGRVSNVMEEMIEDIAIISGQKPIVKNAKKSMN
jgi:large subunit ribosomal protein L5